MHDYNAKSRASLLAGYLQEYTRCNIDEDFKDHISGGVEPFYHFQVVKELRLNIPDIIDQRVIPLFDKRYEGSILLKQLRLLLTEVLDRAQRPAFTTHIDVPSNTLKGERCCICLEDLEDNIANKDWNDHHSQVITSCGHIFGGNCLSTWLSNAKTRSCPYCRKDFNQIAKACDLMWRTWGDMWRWYVERKHSLHCKKGCANSSGRYLWDNCGLGDVQAQFYTQDIIPIHPQHWLYIILDINMFLRAADYLNTKNLRKYMKRTSMVLGGLCDHIPEKEAHAMKSRLRGLLPIGCLDKKELGEWTAEKKHEICAGLLNILHGAVNLFEKHTKLTQSKILKFNETVGEVGMITLDCIQADCGIHNDYYNPVTTQTIWEFIFRFDKETEKGRAPFDECFGFLRREQRAVLEAVRKFSRRISNHLEARSMRAYLIRRIDVIWHFCRMFSEEICIGIGRAWSELVEGDRKICKALEELGSGERSRESMPKSEDGRRR
jgi:hypothetical protein